MIRTEVPVNEVVSVPVKDQNNANVILKDKFPITLEFSSSFDQKKVVKIDNIKERPFFQKNVKRQVQQR